MTDEPANENVDTTAFENARKLRDLRVEHRDLDNVIDHLAKDPDVDHIMLRRLKKRRLVLKDVIERLQSELIPDLNA